MDATPDPRSRWSAWRALAGDLKRPGLVALGVLLILIALIGAFGGWAPAAQGRLPVVGAGETVNLGPWDVTFEKAMLADEVEPWGSRDPSQRYYWWRCASSASWTNRSARPRSRTCSPPLRRADHRGLPGHPEGRPGGRTSGPAPHDRRVPAAAGL
ncbi:MAG: hypothetical protein HZY73_16225 [Micropruina sp.]|nr:MAG: hypothetical protein HZY73_16225 [Micropruina sp.]